MTETEVRVADTPSFKKPVCPVCGSDRILRDAWAEWSASEDRWKLKSTFDSLRCEACDGEIEEPNWVALDKSRIIQIQNDRFRRGEALLHKWSEGIHLANPS